VNRGPLGKLGGRAAVVAIALTAGLAVTAPATPAPQHASAISQKALLSALNRERTKRKLPRLRLSAPLGAAARQHSLEMVRRGYFAHESADGSAFEKRILRFYRAPGYSRFLLGENILYGMPSLTAQQAVAMWMHSPGHRRNILSRSWREIGISAVEATAAPGFYGGRDVVVVTTDFAIRRP